MNLEEIDTPEEHYHTQRNDIQPDSTLYVTVDNTLYSVSFDNQSNINSVVDMNNQPISNIDSINAQFQAGAKLGQAISGENLNEDTLIKSRINDIVSECMKKAKFDVKKQQQIDELNSIKDMLRPLVKEALKKKKF